MHSSQISHPRHTDAVSGAGAHLGAARPDHSACGEHAVQFCHSDDFLVPRVAEYVASGVRTGAAVVAIATAPHREGIVQHLAGLGIDVAASGEEEIVLLDARGTLAQITGPNGVDSARFHGVIGPLVQRALGRGGSHGARVYGEMVDLLWRDGATSDALALEGMWNELITLRPFPLLCAYGMDNFGRESDAEAFDQVCREHGQVFPTETYQAGDELARLAETARLQQRAAALESEVAQRRHLEQQLRDALADREAVLERERMARAEAETANAVKSMFLASMSHELRTPLNAIAGYVDLLGSGIYGPLSEAQSAPLVRIQRSQQHLLSLINDVLDFATIGVGHIQYHRDTVQVPELFTHVEALVMPQATTRGVTVRFEPSPCVIAADEHRMTQVVLNLLSNAIKFTPAGGSVTVAARVAPEPAGEHVEITVRDTGCGIPSAQLDAIFDPFVQVGRRLNQPREGVGLGLAISRDLARAMGGDLRAESTEGSGSTFILLLPAA